MMLSNEAFENTNSILPAQDLLENRVNALRRARHIDAARSRVNRKKSVFGNE